MLLQSIIVELDRHLERLLALRAIVVNLEKTPEAVRTLAVSLPKHWKTEPAPNVPAKRLKKSRRPKNPRRVTSSKKVVVQATGPLVMGRFIPTGPVVVLPRQLMEERDRRLAMQTQTAVAVATAPTEEAADLDEMSRSLSARWFMGSAQ